MFVGPDLIKWGEGKSSKQGQDFLSGISVQREGGLLELVVRGPPPFHQQRGPERLHPGGR